MFKVLVVDDEVELCFLLQTVLESELACEVSIAHDGHEAYQLAKQSPFDLIITDFKMPIMDGAALINAIKTTNTLSKNAKIFLISGHIESSEDGPSIIKDVIFFDKPFDTKKLIANARLVLHASNNNRIA